ncbi:c-type cytochrome [Kallotenue papyrolyticum]|uniref:c-type cytochrome n=1 Tax=Kallotenue papyrolyticum TaxID=1325125 RepID=UPI0004AD5B21|nr:cytochrome c [Kallotenue papyrolyticum]
MYHQPRYDPYESSELFEDGTSARPLPEGTVARGQLRVDTALYAGKDANGEHVSAFPFPITADVLTRGQQRYNAYCAPCHGLSGYGNGMIVERGFSPPSSFHTDRLRNAPVGYYYDVITNGFGRMYSYASRIQPGDRWAIVAYIRALQLSQNASVNDLSPEERQQLQGSQQQGSQPQETQP